MRPLADRPASAVVQPVEMTEETALDSFFAALLRQRTEGGTVRIAYFGDSIVEGDLITQDLRASFQKAFGGGKCCDFITTHFQQHAELVDEQHEPGVGFGGSNHPFHPLFEFTAVLGACNQGPQRNLHDSQ